jgi:hypothetical protein
MEPRAGQAPAKVNDIRLDRKYIFMKFLAQPDRKDLMAAHQQAGTVEVRI